MRRFRVFIERDGARRKNDRLIRLTFSACMVELNRDLRAEAPAFGNERRERVHLLVVPQAETVVRDTAVRHDAGRLYDDESDAAHGAGGVVRKMERIRHSVFRTVHAHRRHDHTVAQRHALYLKRRKQLHFFVVLSSAAAGLSLIITLKRPGDKLRVFGFCSAQTAYLAMDATSAAKSSTFFSMPSPFSKRTHFTSLISPPSSLATALMWFSTETLFSLTKACCRRQFSS